MGCSNTKADRVTMPSTSHKQTGGDDHAADSKSHEKMPVSAGLFVHQNQAVMTDIYKPLKMLGTGAYGEVILCRERSTKIERAVKRIKKNKVC